VKLEDYEGWDDERLIDTINEAFALAMGKKGHERRVLLVEAEFYVRELDRRRNKRAEENRDHIETERWRIDLRYERWIVTLIILEIVLAALLTWWTDNRQSKSAQAELAALQGVQQVLTQSEESSLAPLPGTHRSRCCLLGSPQTGEFLRASKLGLQSTC
jgi:hypothetical protein